LYERLNENKQHNAAAAAAAAAQLKMNLAKIN